MLCGMLALRSDTPPASTSFASLVFPTTDSAPTNAKTDLTKTVIEWLFVVIAVILIACLFLRKMFGSRTSRHEMYISDSRDASFALPPADSPSYLCTYAIAYPGIPAVQGLPYPLPAHTRSRTARPPVRTTRGLDIDEGGRRANFDMELVLSDKDVLPAYDALDRPPKYASVATARAAGVEQVTVAGASNAEVIDAPSTHRVER